MKTIMALIVAIVILASCHLRAPRAGAYSDWTCWKGAAGTGVSCEKIPRPKVIESKNAVNWSAEIGAGYSGITVANGKVYTMGQTGRNAGVFCLDMATGKTLWKHEWPSKDVHWPGPRATVNVADGTAFAVSQQGDILSLNAETGTVNWKTELIKEGAAQEDWYGICSSPVLLEDKVFINSNSAGVCLDKRTGKIIWKSEPGKASYSTPVIEKYKGKDYMYLLADERFVVSDPCTGKILWEVPFPSGSNNNSTDPIINGDKIFLVNHKGCAYLKMTEDGPNVIWKGGLLTKEFDYPLLYLGKLYALNGSLPSMPFDFRSLDLESRRLVWSIPSGDGSHTIADDKLISISSMGVLSIFDISQGQHKLLAKSKVIGMTVITPPTLSNGKLFLRNEKGTVVCLQVN